MAKDVLKRIYTRQIVPQTGTYLYVEIPDALKTSQEIDLQHLLSKKGVECQACALGSAICSIAHFSDKIAVDDDGFQIQEDRSVDFANENKLRKIFGSNLELIEYAFEANGDDWGSTMTEASWKLSDKQKEAANAFSDKYKSDKQRLIAIMKNIIKNDGHFIP